jgi:hypothetical protein
MQTIVIVVLEILEQLFRVDCIVRTSTRLRGDADAAEEFIDEIE